MPAGRERFGDVRPRERVRALVAAVVVQCGLALALLSGFTMPTLRDGDVAERLIDVQLPRPALRPSRSKPAKAVRHAPASRRTEPRRAWVPPRPNQPAAVVSSQALLAPSVPLSGGNAGIGTARGNGSNAGSGGSGTGGDGGTDLVQIAGAILPSDYPRDLRDRDIGGRVGVLFTVGPNGRVANCSITRPSGVPELDVLTCRLIRERFVYRPSTDSRGQRIADEIEGEHDWIAARR